ncbi:MAG: sulfatase-like hydrolase/transferase, partial [bacterium]
YISKMDAKVGELLKELEENGLAEDTIVFYYSDHGGVLPRSKRFLYESGTKIPLIIRFPQKYQHLTSKQPGSREDRLVSLVDLAPTMFSLLNITIPVHFSGHAFLGNQTSAEPAYVHFFRQRMDERYDMMRAVRDKEFRYIRNYMPHRKYGQHLWYLWRSPATRVWETAFKQGKCNTVQSRFWREKEPEELYHIKTDPHNVNNLANDPQYHNVLERMRKETSRWVRVSRDAGFLPEGLMIELAGDKTVYEITHSSHFPMEKIIETAEMASSKNIKYLSTLIKRLSHTQATIRYWAATGCAILGNKAKPAVPELTLLLKDPFADVRITAAEALCTMGPKKESLDLLVQEMRNENPWVQLHAPNVLSALGNDPKMVIKDIMSLTPWGLKTDDYFHQAYIQLLKELKPGWGDYVIW